MDVVDVVEYQFSALVGVLALIPSSFSLQTDADRQSTAMTHGVSIERRLLTMLAVALTLGRASMM